MTRNFPRPVPAYWLLIAALLAAAVAIAAPDPAWPQAEESPPESVDSSPVVRQGIADLGLLEARMIDCQGLAGAELEDCLNIGVEQRSPVSFLAAVMSRAGANPGAGFTLPSRAQACFEGGSVDGNSDGIPRQRRYPVDQSALPWGTIGNGPWAGTEVLRQRYSAGVLDTGWHCGQAAELFELYNTLTLQNACQGLCNGPPVAPAGRDCNPTIMEKNDLGYFAPRCSSWYLDCVRRKGTGGTPELPSVINESNWGSFKGLIESNKVCALGPFSKPGRVCNWPTYYRLDWLPTSPSWCASTPPPPPDPEPPPPPSPEPPPPTPLIPGGINPPGCIEARRNKCSGQAEEGYRARWCAECFCPEGVTPGQPPYCKPVPVEPPPPPTCAECEAGGYTDPLCGHCPCPDELVDPSGHVHTVPGRFCTPEPPAELCPVSGWW